MSTWSNRQKRSTGQPLNYSDILDFSDTIDGVAVATVFTNKTKH